jgi:hypothetical protein
VFSGKNGDSTGLWKIPISPKTWQVAGAPQRLTVGVGVYSYASASAGRLVFSSLTRNPEIWSLAVDAGRPTGQMQQLTHDAGDDVSPSVSADGKRMVFESNRTGKRVVWTKDLETGRIKALTDTPSSENLPVISADGSQVAYLITSVPKYDYEVYTIPFEGGPPKKVCDNGNQLFQWSSDRSKVLIQAGQDNDPPPRLAWLDVRTGQQATLLQHPKHKIWAGYLSPDERWIAFEVFTQPSEPFQCFIAPLHDGAAVSESTWIPITRGHVRWSPDENLLYSFDESDGFACLYAHRLDQKTKRPAGPPQPVHHFHSARHSVIEDPAWRWSVARDKIVVTLVELTGNIWMAEPQGR